MSAINRGEDNQLRQRKKKSEQSAALKPQESTAGIPPRSPYKTVLTRMATGACLISFLSLVILSDHVIIALFVVALQIVVFKEILGVRYQAAKEKAIPRFRTLNWFFLLISLFYVYGKQVLTHLPFTSSFAMNITKYHLGISFVLYILGFVTFIITLKKKLYKYQMGQMTWTLMTLLFVVAQSNYMIQNIFEGIIWFLLPCAIVVINDIFAYFSGIFFGHRWIQRPLMKVSPNKTWEGFIGATFWTLLFAFLFSDLLSRYSWFICPRTELDFLQPVICQPKSVFAPTHYYLPETLANIFHNQFKWDLSYITLRPIQLHALVLALFGSLIAPFGGFFTSAIKRAYNVKDFDTIFPGHGGFTDRTDCQYIMFLFTHVYTTIFIKTSLLDVDAIIETTLMLSLEQQLTVLRRLNETVTQALLQNAMQV